MEQNLEDDLKKIAKKLKAQLNNKIKHLPQLKLGTVYRENNINLCQKEISSFETSVTRTIKQYGDSPKNYKILLHKFENKAEDITRKINLLR